jgi:hypothetical protein
MLCSLLWRCKTSFGHRNEVESCKFICTKILCFTLTVPGQSVGGDGLLLIYLQILASLTVNISKMYTSSKHGSQENGGDSDVDSNSEMDHGENNVEELQVCRYS